MTVELGLHHPNAVDLVLRQQLCVVRGRWTADGTWDRILARAQVFDDGRPVQWTISVDSSIVRAHQHAAGARKKGALQVSARPRW